MGKKKDKAVEYNGLTGMHTDAIPASEATSKMIKEIEVIVDAEIADNTPEPSEAPKYKEYKWIPNN